MILRNRRPLHRDALSLLGLLAAGCSDYALKGGDAGGGPGFDSGDSAPLDSEETDVPDTEESTSDQVCPDQVFPGGGLAQNADCYHAPSTGTFTPVVEWTYDTFVIEPDSNNVMATPIVVSLTDDDGDGLVNENDTPDIVFVTYTGTSWSDTGVIRAVSGDGTTDIFDITGQSIDGCSGLAAGDLDGDGRVEIVAITTTHLVKAFDATGSILWTSRSVAADDPPTSGAPAIADMDGDGSPEIIIGRAILNADGTLRGEGAYGTGTAGVYSVTSFAADLDGDGNQEVVVGNALYDIDGNALWYNGLSDGYVAAADFDGDGDGEIVVSGNGKVRLQDGDGSVIWASSIPSASSGFGGPPTIADFDGDGEPEIGVAANSTYTVFDTDGSVLWQAHTQDSSSGVTGSSVFDFEGDGVAEAIYADELHTWAFNGTDGAVKFSSADHSNWTVTEYPVIADVDGDDEAEIVVPNGLHPSYSSSARHGIVVLGDADHSWRSGRRIWNQHAYSITNVDDDGTIPAHPAQNWPLYNNFRSGDISAALPTATPDLVLSIEDVCNLQCDEGELDVWVSVGNPGYVDIAGPVTLLLEVETSAGWVALATTSLPGPITAGTSTDAIAIAATGLPAGPLLALRVTVDTDGAWTECDEANNSAEVADNLCP